MSMIDDQVFTVRMELFFRNVEGPEGGMRPKRVKEVSGKFAKYIFQTISRLNKKPRTATECRKVKV